MKKVLEIGKAHDSEANQERGPSGFRLASTSDLELLRYGMAVKYSCASLAGQPETEALLAKLNDIRREWQKRYPDLPLRDSF